MKHFAILLMLIPAVCAGAMTPFSELLENGTVVDTAKYEATYTLRFKDPPADKDFKDDTRILQIGRRHVKDFSYIIYHYDSLATEQIRQGADSHSNISGNPWPLEILRNERNRTAETKYRLPMQSTLHYKDSLPCLDWKFDALQSETILGYECRKATVDFAGRTYSVWFALELPLPYGPYKFGGLPGLILRIQDAKGQFIWECVGLEKSSKPIISYEYNNEKDCTSEQADKTVARLYSSYFAFIAADGGIDRSRIMVRASDGKWRKSSEVEDVAIPYEPIEIRVKK